ncbi:bifunctional pyr operon transcriptional regulator/uracil phosphoribosyltransferase PyrR [Syntrophorhabdus aromaticivorans]|jgi:pyrimidine operon attenuation protein/uracil phosphoribosyltransferase|uniref:Bifunctional protein PyrR n=1 Tax=Syntrophorhabdus aromaticivorans TaxID=328301 RepID=A0A351U083_9BACT|nr:bifunctional pyr operon transcriptional regulator/uracil phosphoribosyltransferase PyrR [Syntrophorhabdus aromaticivorans]NLW36768.1 bifunctional pyr operon transcriptional regulator/uracil phosphoribosyltransferase PyrR [Syntrophorhabdus aromaticivorans]HBA53364.1 bifunctional pyr operon transcriptional regulator/uracil phosphoribosyltransferase PyrR [Syntrophorhabdus aromaticivorans]
MKTKVLLDKKGLERTVNRIAHEIIEKNQGVEALSLIGIRTRGVHLAHRIREKVKDIENIELPLGVLDITMYRDDVFKLKSPEVKKTEIPFDVNNMTIILIDDVMQTGRTTRAAIDAIMDLGRPKRIQLAVLIDRGDRELPIHPDYAGSSYRANPEEAVVVRLREVDEKDEVVVVRSQ